MASEGTSDTRASDEREMNLSLLAHAGEPLAPHDLWRAWNTEPAVLIPLMVSVLIYLLGARNAWRRAGAGRGIKLSHGFQFAGAVFALELALVSPLDALSDSLFSAHMVQHLILILVAAPLLVLSEFPLAALWALPRSWARGLGQRLNRARWLARAWGVLAGPLQAWLIFTATLWAWHAPGLYQLALESETVHALEHLMFLATALLFWWVLLRRTQRGYVRYGVAVLYLFATALQGGLLGALMTFSARPWYPFYAPLVAPWGLTPLEDQQLAGLIMWIPGGTVYTALAIGYFAAWLRALDRRSMRLDAEQPAAGGGETEL